MIVVYILIAILMFGLLIAVHEFGHFAAAKLMGVRVNEFAIGMGPRLLHRKRGETEYTLRLFPIGGFCAMEGEDEDSKDPRAMSNQPAWRRLIILVAGAFMNFVTGVLVFFCLFLFSASPIALTDMVITPTIDSLMTGFPLEGADGLLPGDRIVKVDGHQIYLREDIDLFLSRAGKTVDLVLERDGEKILRKDFPLQKQNYLVDGKERLMYGLVFETKTADFGDKLQLTLYNSIDTVRLVWVSLGDLVTGAVGLRDMSGPVGIVDMIGKVGSNAESFALAARGILYFVAFIAINLAVMNLLPIPALDGGQILFLLVDKVYSLFSKRHINQKYLGYINIAGFFLLIALMVVVALSDVLKLFGR
ncbi:MAG: site-2 protease family protein [Pseudoflavonifractor sp.]